MAAFLHSGSKDLVPPQRRGSESFALSHVTDVFATLAVLAGASAGGERSASSGGGTKTKLTGPGPERDERGGGELEMDGLDVWQAWVHGAPSPRTEMVYNIDPLGLGNVAGGFMQGNQAGIMGGQKSLSESLSSIASARGISVAQLGVDDVAAELVRRRSSAAVRTMINANVPEIYGAIRVGKWKLITGYPGRGDWYGTDPTDTWLADYIVRQRR